jgi:hypothetical protein
MRSFKITLENGLALTIRPQSEVHADGHPILTYKYSIYVWSPLGIEDATIVQGYKDENPDYFGTISLSSLVIYSVT